MYSLIKKQDGSTVVRYYQNGYNPANSSYGVELSDNLLAPDFSKGPNVSSWLYPVTGNQQNIVRIKMTGTRQNILNSDFELANKASQIPNLEIGKASIDYTWHHLDDFEVDVNGDMWCTMQLVRQDVHRTTFVHTGSPAQYTDYTGIPYK